MKQISWIVAFALILGTGCQSGESESKNGTTDITPVIQVVETDGPHKAVAKLAIEGMACEMACGGAIKKALGEIDGVIATEIDFDSEKNTDYAIVEYDESKVGSDEMVFAVSTLHNGHYKVSGVTIEKFVAKNSGTGEKSSAAAESSETKDEKKIDTRTITVPNFLDILNRLLVRN